MRSFQSLQGTKLLVSITHHLRPFDRKACTLVGMIHTPLELIYFLENMDKAKTYDKLYIIHSRPNFLYA